MPLDLSYDHKRLAEVCRRYLSAKASSLRSRPSMPPEQRDFEKLRDMVYYESDT